MFVKFDIVINITFLVTLVALDYIMLYLRTECFNRWPYLCNTFAF